ncbi:hypothetical protein UFOVP168_41 [uncultured Caudovirales phage]|uniref:Uncharacterized protein n=1 Tax=uncultured Caudovirales phage TaxID=2100421 RepID=A0A6J7WF85_9CAUD|nr:hypothetical protein UFOVP168_41 [uncultured Caudovirales phage]
MTSLADFDALLARADWHYQRADDPMAYRRGAASMAALGRIDSESPAHLALLKAWSNYAYSTMPEEQARATRDAARRELLQPTTED